MVAFALFVDYFFLASCSILLPGHLRAMYSPLWTGLVFAMKPMLQFALHPCLCYVVNKRGPIGPFFVGLFLLGSSALLFAYGRLHALVLMGTIIH